MKCGSKLNEIRACVHQKPKTHWNRKWQLTCSCSISLACVASVSLLFRSKERPRNEILGFGRARNATRGKKWKRERGRGRKETLADKPPDFENLRSPANAEPDWLGYLTRIDQSFVSIWRDLEFNMPEELDVLFEASFQKALNFLSERGFNRELRQE